MSCNLNNSNQHLQGELGSIPGRGHLTFSRRNNSGRPIGNAHVCSCYRPLIDALKCDNNSTKQIWYAAAAGSLSALKQWWQRLSEIGPSFGYYANASKTWLVMKERYLSHVQESFKDTEVNITTERRPLLGAAIGKISFVSEYVTQKVQTWVKELENVYFLLQKAGHMPLMPL